MKTLLLTVGGSPEPLLKAIAEERPDRAVFFCTGKDPATNAPGSDQQVGGPGGLVAGAGLAQGQYEIKLVLADDLAGCVAVMLPALAAAAGDAVADYTGGTKSMGAALALAALESSAVRLRFTGGARPDLQRVAGGTERGIPISLAHLRFERALGQAVGLWSGFAYAESEQLLKAIADCPLADQPRLTRAASLSQAFAAWDRFDHAAAQHTLAAFRPAVGAALGRHLTALELLTEPGPRQIPGRLWDLWRNAERRAAQGRYEDALARWYRFTEWLAQWILEWRWGIDCARIPADQIPAGLELPLGREGQRQAGLFDAWRLIAAKRPDLPAAQFFTARHTELLGLLRHRNGALLAHGFTPVTAADWKGAEDFTAAQLLPLLKSECEASAPPDSRPLLAPWPQLPGQYVWF